MRIFIYFYLSLPRCGFSNYIVQCYLFICVHFTSFFYYYYCVRGFDDNELKAEKEILIQRATKFRKQGCPERKMRYKRRNKNSTCIAYLCGEMTYTRQVFYNFIRKISQPSKNTFPIAINVSVEEKL